MTKKLIALSSITLLFAACAPTATDTMMDDESDDTMMEEMREDMDDMDMDDMDDGMVMGETHEDAGGDGTNTTGGDTMIKEGARVVSIEATDWAFIPDTITAKKGEDVVLQIEAVTGSHGLAIPELGVQVKIPQGQTVSVSLPTDTVGTFGGMCSVPCGKGHKDMQVTVVISE